MLVSFPIKVVVNPWVPFNLSAKVWSEANKTCINSGAHLVSIHSEPEDAAVLKMWSHLAVEELWIGLYDNAVSQIIIL